MTFDFRRYFPGLSLSDIGGAVSYGEAILLVQELQREFGSHLAAELMGWEFAAGYGEVMAGLHASAYMSVHFEKPQIFMPWTDTPTVTPEERARLKEALKRRSAFRQ